MGKKTKVFVSHKKEDKEYALSIVRYIKSKGIDAYIDVLDGQITQKNVTERIVENLRDSTHLLVIYSNFTKYSEWVPFELGVGYERNEGIGILKHNFDGWLPQYLHEFPVMNDLLELNKFIERCKSPCLGLYSEMLNDDVYNKPDYASNFIRVLKNDLIRSKYAY